MESDGLKNETEIVPTGRIINMWKHTGWGNSISFTDWEKRRLVGHLPNRPKIGDEIRSKMESGEIGRFLVSEVEYCRDPKDMFFCTVKDLKYL